MAFGANSFPPNFSNGPVLEGLGDFFSHVELVLFRGDKFAGHAGGLNGGLVLYRCLVVEDLMHVWG